MKIRLDHLLVRNGHTLTRSQAESYIRLGQVKVDGRIIKNLVILYLKMPLLNLASKNSMFLEQR